MIEPNDGIEPNDADELLFAAEDEQEDVYVVKPWKILIVDDETDVHAVTRMVLSEVKFEGRGLVFLSAYSGREAREMMHKHQDICVVLLDVVMESIHEGLEVAKFIREDLMNSQVRIILRTGQPGQAPERDVISKLDINDYKQKAELSSTKLFTSVITALRSYRDLRIIEENRKGLQQMALSVAHQVRNRVVSISGFTNLALKKGRSEHCAVEEYLGPVLEESRLLEGIVLAVSAYAQLPEPILRPTPVLSTLLDLVDDLRGRHPGRAIEFENRLGNENAQAFMDRTLALRCFAELGNNALDFSKEEDGPVQIHVFGNDTSCSLHIVDTGQGMPEDAQPFIFDPFYTTKPRGVGMGLAVVDRLAREHKWDVQIFSHPGKGTSALVHIPLI